MDSKRYNILNDCPQYYARKTREHETTKKFNLGKLFPRLLLTEADA